jgi:hypothetical protein
MKKNFAQEKYKSKTSPGKSAKNKKILKTAGVKRKNRIPAGA